MKRLKAFNPACTLIAVSLMSTLGQSAEGANIYAELAAAPVLLDGITANNPAEIGKWEYVYDIMMDNESQFDEFQLEGFDTTRIVNQNPFTFGSVTGILTQKWDGYAGSTSVNSWDQTAYGSFNSGGNWTIPTGYTDLGEGILNAWHTPTDYQGTSSWAGVDPKFITPGQAVTSSIGVSDGALRFANSVPTGTLYTGLVLTVRIVHPEEPGTIEMRAYSFNAGGTVYQNSVIGPAASGVPEPGTFGILTLGLLAAAALLRHKL